MKKHHWLIFFGVNLFTIILVLSPFLPGPDGLSIMTNKIFSLAQVGSFFGFFLIAAGLIWISQRIVKNKMVNIWILLLFSIPTVSLISSTWGASLARDFSRAFAIDHATELIHAIEDYKEKNQSYPVKLSELIPDRIKNIPTPGIMGIKEFRYAKTENSYTISFTQNLIIGFNFEVVVYDPSGNFESTGTYQTMYDTKKEHWKYYIHD